MPLQASDGHMRRTEYGPKGEVFSYGLKP